MHRPRRLAVRRLRQVLPPMVVGALTLALLAGISGALPGAPARPARADEVMASQDPLRTGWDPNEPELSPSVVAGGTFGQLFSTPVNGQVYAQPIVVGSTVIVATESDWAYGLDAANGAVKWSLSLGTPWPASTIDCGTIWPVQGVTSTPVYDPGSNTVYLMAESVPAGDTAYQPEWDLVGLDPQTGAVTEKVPITGAPVNAPTRPFNPLTQMQRPALLMMAGSVYAAFGSQCDFPPYVGYVAGINVTTRSVTLWSDESGITDSMAGIWQSGGGLVSDGPGRIFFTSGNGVSPAPGPGGSPPSALAESVVRLRVNSDGTLSAKDFFSPANAPTLDAADVDLGSGGPVGLPIGSATYPHLLVQAGKDGRMFVLNRDNLGGREQGPGGGDAVISGAGPFSGEWGHPAVFEASTSPLPANSSGLDDYVYYLGTGDEGASDVLRALQLSVTPAGTPVLADVANSDFTFAMSSGSPVVTSDGPDASTAVVWVVGASDIHGTSGTLYAFDAVPQLVNGALQLKQIWSAPIGTASKFAIPATDSGRVFVGTRDGHVLAFGSPSSAPLGPLSPTTFPGTAVGSSSGPQNVTVTATRSVTVSQPAVSATTSPVPFALGQITETPSGGAPNPVTSFPVSLNEGDSLTVPVTFAPSAAGGATGSLSFPTTDANHPTVNVSLSGKGTQDGFSANPSSIGFGALTPVPVGTSPPATVAITNTGATGATVTSVTPATGPFVTTGLPAVGTDIPPGGSITVTVRYTPTAATTSGTDTGSFAIDGSTGNLVVHLTGRAVAGHSALTASPGAVKFGSVHLGQQATAIVTVANTGNLPAAVRSSRTPNAPFGTPDPATAGLPVNPGYRIKIPVTFTPAGLGDASWTYRLTWTDPQGTHTLRVPVTGTGAPSVYGRTAIAPPGGGWRLNGSARMTGTSLELTRAAKRRAGSAVYPVRLRSNGLKARYTVRIGGGTGGEGMTFSLLDAARSGPTSLGRSRGLLGFGGLHGVAVALVTHKSAGDPSAHFVGIATGARRGHLVFAAINSHIRNLRKGTHSIVVRVEKRRKKRKITVSVDGARYLSATVRLPRHVLAAFTASTGSRTDQHIVRRIHITANGHALPAPGGGWSFNPAAGMAGSDITLTPARTYRAGAVIYPTPLPAEGLKVTFNAQLSGGTGGDGLTFALLNPAQTTPASVGGSGPQLGLGGLSGIGVVLDTHQVGRYPSGNFAAISNGSGGNVLWFQATAQAIAPLRAGTHIVRLRVTTNPQGTDVIIVWLDGEQILQQTEPLLNQWKTVRLAFTGGTGSLTDVHTVRTVAISANK